MHDIINTSLSAMVLIKNSHSVHCYGNIYLHDFLEERRKLGGGSERHYRLEGGVTET
jgi:hypothetical protein